MMMITDSQQLTTRYHSFPIGVALGWVIHPHSTIVWQVIDSLRCKLCQHPLITRAYGGKPHDALAENTRLNGANITRNSHLSSVLYWIEVKLWCLENTEPPVN